jgi:hypothetical protein
MPYGWLTAYHPGWDAQGLEAQRAADARNEERAKLRRELYAADHVQPMLFDVEPVEREAAA